MHKLCMNLNVWRPLRRRPGAETRHLCLEAEKRQQTENPTVRAATAARATHVPGDTLQF